jgi:sec-independent protein translocase protein TatA
MGAFSIWHWLILLVVVLVLFGGGGKISRMMGDFGKGLNAFKKGIKENADEAPTAPAASAENKSIEGSEKASDAAADKDQAAKS